MRAKSCDSFLSPNRALRYWGRRGRCDPLVTSNQSIVRRLRPGSRQAVKPIQRVTNRVSDALEFDVPHWRLGRAVPSIVYALSRSSRLGSCFVLAFGWVYTTATPSTLDHNSRRTTVLVVSVGDAAGGQFIPNAEVRLPEAGRVARTGWDGEAAFTGLETGRYRLQVRAIGYAAVAIDVLLKGDTVGVFCQLERVAALDTVHVVSVHTEAPPIW